MSDQDFFFDDEDAAPAPPEAPAKSDKQDKKAAAKPDSKASAATAVTAGGQLFEQNVTLAVAALLMVIALLVGVIIGIFVGGAISTPAAQTATTGTESIDSGTSGAQPLSQDQLNSGQLPAGHPSIGGTATTTP